MNFFLINRRGNKESFFLTCLLESRLILCLQTFRLEFRLYATQQRFCVGLHRQWPSHKHHLLFPIRLSSFSLSSLLLLLLIISFSCSSFDYWFKIKLAQGRNVSYIIIVCVFFLELEEEHIWITHDSGPAKWFSKRGGQIVSFLKKCRPPWLADEENFRVYFALDSLIMNCFVWNRRLR